MLQIVSYHMLLLANLMGTPLHEYILGWSIIACIGAFFLVNMGYMLSLSLTELFRKLYLRRLKQKAEKRRKQQENERIENSKKTLIELVQRN